MALPNVPRLRRIGSKICRMGYRWMMTATIAKRADGFGRGAYSRAIGSRSLGDLRKAGSDLSECFLATARTELRLNVRDDYRTLIREETSNHCLTPAFQPRSACRTRGIFGRADERGGHRARGARNAKVKTQLARDAGGVLRRRSETKINKQRDASRARLLGLVTFFLRGLLLEEQGGELQEAAAPG
jgi:hypothetical protein